eukprot:TRINITY_DN6402_c0_g1_i2.p1 TRINITY_DN6402_c0_g1~~TRINITY_DN6402_c0_g1_i2.p1  ORF type:complete len:557 (+),score=181.04 TRINITY_DN6402_c0_g1_i2:60-1730(+)
MVQYATAHNLTALNADLDTIKSSLDDTSADMNVFWLIFGGALVFFMQAGFGMLEAGCVRSSSVVNIVFKNLCDACIGAVMFYMFGWALAYGDDLDSKSRNGFLGNAAFFLVTDANGGYQDGLAEYGGFEPRAFASWFFQFAFCATAATIVSGAIAERTQLNAYFAYSAWICGFVYPVVVHWTWSSAGWASPWVSYDQPMPRLGKGLMDFAGSGVVHMVGGFAALAGAMLVGPRRGRKTASQQTPPFRFAKDSDPTHFIGHNKVHQVLGMFILWTGWFGFNCVSTLEMTPGSAPVASRTAVTTMLGACGGGFATLMIDLILQKVRHIEPKVDPTWVRWAEENGQDTTDPPKEAILGATLNFEIECVVNGILAGLVSITAGCSLVEPWAALVIGMLGGAVYTGASGLMVKVKIDDPLDAFAVHGACGFWGLVATGLWATAKNVAEVYPANNFVNATHPGDMPGDEYYGAFYGGDGKQFGIQLLVGLVIAAWAFSMAFLCFFLLKLTGNLRVADDQEGYAGLDSHEHGASAYTGMPAVKEAAGNVRSPTAGEPKRVETN